MKQILQNKVRENGIVKIITEYKKEMEEEEQHQYNIICIRRKRKLNQICDYIFLTLILFYFVVSFIVMLKFMTDIPTKYIFDFF